jgi:hypothetical protein
MRLTLKKINKFKVRKETKKITNKYEIFSILHKLL